MNFNINKFAEIKDNINKFALNKVKIVAISKNHPVESVQEAIEAGVEIFGENRVQEALKKFKELKSKNSKIELHLTGPLQTNKVKQCLKIFDVIQTLDREKLAREFCKFPELTKNKKFFIQVNVGKESNKSGIMPEDANSFIKYCNEDLKLNIYGLMCIPPFNENSESYFNELKIIAQKNNIKNLSMGMSADYIQAIKSGATYIRTGTILFGKRNYED